MAVWRFRSKNYLVSFVAIVTVIFLIGQLFDKGDDTVNKRNNIFGNLAFLKSSSNQKSGGSRVSHSVPEVDDLIEWYLTQQDAFGARYTLDVKELYEEFLQKLNRYRPIGVGLRLNMSDNGHSWQRFYREIEQYALYNPHKQYTVEEMLDDLAASPIVKTEGRLEYSQATLIVTLANGAQGIFKGKKFERDYQTPPDLMYFSEFDRHNAEIAAFHLDRILGFYRAPPTVGRWINVSSEVVASANTVLYQSPVGNSCFLVKCRQYSSSMYGLCGQPHMLEGSLTISLPGRLVPNRNDDNRHPWARTYNISKASWEVNEAYCEKVVKTDPKYGTGRILLDLTDLAVFDFLTGNMNRSHYERFPEFEKDTFLFHVDNAGGFSKATYDCHSCLAPLRQCCMIRQSTVVKLVKLYIGPDSLSGLLRTSLDADPVAPILSESHLDAVDRRLGKVLKTVGDCIRDKGSWREVVRDDKF